MRENTMPTTLGVCSWSLQPASPADLIDKVQQTGCNAVQLHLDPLREDWSSSETASRLSESGIKAVSGMMTMEGEDYTTLETIKATGGVRCDDTWPANREAAEHNAALAASLGIQLVTFHAGWIPHESDSSERAVMIDRVRELGRIFAQSGVAVSLETGQETAQTLLGVLDELP
ncbi:MAG: TIM barrel protein, partial [Planctomycetota bacterium]